MISDVLKRANNQSICKVNDLKVDTGLKSGIYCKASLITADATQNGRIIKNLQPISMGV